MFSDYLAERLGPARDPDERWWRRSTTMSRRRFRRAWKKFYFEMLRALHAAHGTESSLPGGRSGVQLRGQRKNFR